MAVRNYLPLLCALLIILEITRIRVLQRNASSEKFSIRSGVLIALSIIIILYYGLVEIRSLAYHSYSIIFGGLPFSDAAGYFSGSHLYIETGVLQEWNSRRPMHTLILASLIHYISNNLITLQTFYLALSFVSIFSFAIHTAKRLGLIVGLYAASLMALHVVENSSLGMLSESSGLIVGVSAYLLLIKAIEKASFNIFILGSFLTAIGHCIRPGAMFILPALIIPIAFIFSNNFRSKLKCSAFTLLAILSAFFLNYLLKFYIGSENQVLFSNFSYTLYGLAKGGAGWQQIFIDSPEILSMNEANQASFISARIFELLTTQPLLFVKGVLSSFCLVLIDGTIVNYLAYETTITFIIIPFWVGCYYLIKQRKSNFSFFSLSWMAIAMILSIPFIVDEVARVNTVSLPLFITIIGYGLVFICNLGRAITPPAPIQNYSETFAANLITGVLALLFFIIIIDKSLIPKEGTSNTLPSHNCSADELKVQLALTDLPKVEIYPDSQLQSSFFPRIKNSDFNLLIQKYLNIKNVSVNFSNYNIYFISNIGKYLLLERNSLLHERKLLCIKKAPWDKTSFMYLVGSNHKT